MSPPSSSSPLRKRIFVGTFIHTPILSPPTISVLENAVVGVDERGVIGFIEEQVEGLYEWDNEDGDSVDGLTRGMRDVMVKNGWEVKDVEEAVVGGYSGSGWWFPGFVGEFLRTFSFLLCLGKEEGVRSVVAVFLPDGFVKDECRQHFEEAVVFLGSLISRVLLGCRCWLLFSSVLT